MAGEKGTRGKGGLATEAFDRGLGSEPVRRWDRIRSFTGGWGGGERKRSRVKRGDSC